LLHAAGLESTKEAAAALGGEAGAVDNAVDDPLVDYVVQEPSITFWSSQ
jgi:hypothetical protein